MKVLANKVELNVEVNGDDLSPCVTFVTGITNDHTLWHDQVDALSAKYRLIRIDSRGHGYSQSTPAPYSLKTIVADVLGVWDALSIKRSVIVGLGLGGVVAAETALNHPDRVSGVVPTSCRARMVPEYGAMWPLLIDKAKAGGVAAIAEATLARWFSEEFRANNPVVIERMRAAILRTTLDGYLGCISALLELNWWDRLAEFKMPVMYVSGEFDRVGAPPAIVQAMCDATPGATHAILPGASHISVVSNPVAFNQAMLGFLAKL
ncbi:MAG: alpha/beta fold hydrolase [Burkholderiales bacterium]